MNLRYAIDNVIQTKENENWVNLDQLISSLNSFMTYYPDTYDEDEIEKHLKQYWLQRRYCTDTHVGLSVICLDGKPIALHHLPSRKSTAQIKFVDENSIDDLKNFLISHVKTNPFEQGPDILSDDEMSEPFPQFYRVTYSDELLDDQGFYNNMPATYQRHSTQNKELRKEYPTKKIHIRINETGEDLIISVNEFKIPAKLQTEQPTPTIGR